MFTKCSLFSGKNYKAMSVMITLLRKPVPRFISEWKEVIREITPKSYGSVIMLPI